MKETAKPISSFFADSIDRNGARDNNSLREVLFELSELFGLKHTTYFGSNIPSDTGIENVLITTYDQRWIDYYFSNHYEDIDPVLPYGNRSLLPLQWSDIPKKQNSVSEFFSASQDFGVGRQGVTIAVRGLSADSALISYNKDSAKAEWEQFCDVALPDLTYLAFLLHEQVLANRSELTATPRKRLTSREAETLRWAARGKTAWETAKILNLSEKTVSFYLSNACAKLSVASKTQAVATAVSQRLILI